MHTDCQPPSVRLGSRRIVVGVSVKITLENRMNWLQIINLYDFQNQKQILRSASGGLKHAAVHITSSMSARSSRGLVSVITQIVVNYFFIKKQINFAKNF